MRVFGIATAIAVCGITATAPGGSETLGLSTVPYFHKARRGRNGMTRYARRLIECAGVILDKEVPKEIQAFLTLTLPPEAVEVCTQRVLGRVLADFQQELKRLLGLSGLPAELLGCTEAHPARSEQSGRMTPHWHLVFQGRHRGKSWALPCSEYARLWAMCVRRHLPGMEMVGFASAVRVEGVQKSVARYLSKYMSKSCKEIVKCPDGFVNDLYPGSWHLISRELLHKVQRATRVFTGEIADRLQFLIRNATPSLVLYSGDVHIATPEGQKIWVGSYARLINLPIWNQIIANWNR